jgi:rhodanese-related sulfurtransferase
MLKTIKQLLGMEPPANYKTLVQEGAVILDVRTKGEFKGGHIKGSINIAVDDLSNNLHRIPDKQKAIITCCASGMRSASARRLLTSAGYQTVHNGGSWSALQHKI